MFNPEGEVHECRLCDGTYCYDLKGEAMLANTGVGEVPINLDKIKIVSFPIRECPIRMILLGGTKPAQANEA